jgi:hypothetical protein
MKNLGEPLRASRSRRAIRSITFGRAAVAPEVRPAACPTVVPLLSLSLDTPKRNGSLEANRSFKRQFLSVIRIIKYLIPAYLLPEPPKAAIPLVAPKVRLARGIVAEPPKRRGQAHKCGAKRKHAVEAKPDGAKVMERIARREREARSGSPKGLKIYYC